jgi:hypothetical protein
MGRLVGLVCCFRQPSVLPVDKEESGNSKAAEVGYYQWVTFWVAPVSLPPCMWLYKHRQHQQQYRRG